jgi:hypothetical protein
MTSRDTLLGVLAVLIGLQLLLLLQLEVAVDLMKILGVFGRLSPSSAARRWRGDWVLDWLCEGKEERRGKAER